MSSGAVAAGVAALGLAARPTDMATLQALSAAGQPRLMRSWDAALAAHGLVPAQALLVPHDFVDRRQYLHARRTLTRLLELGTVPIINENDAIASDEIRYGDNDRLAALVAHNVGAAVLVLLTDLDGLYTADPRLHADAELVARVAVDDPLLAIRAGARRQRPGERRDGEQAGGGPHRLVVGRAHGDRQRRPRRRARRRRRRRRRSARRSRPIAASCGARKLWIAFAARVAGTVTVDDGARRALVERQTSLLPAGVVDVAGRFGEGDTVDVVGTDGVAVRPGHGVRRGRPAAQGRRPPHQRPARRAWSTRSSTATTSSCCRLSRRSFGIGRDRRRIRTQNARWSGRRGCSGGAARRGVPCSTAAAPGRSRPSSARSSLRRLWASTLAVACSTSSTRDSTDASVSSAVALALA